MAAVLAAALVLFAPAAPPSDGGFEPLAFGAACEKAAAERRVVVLELTTAWSAPAATPWADAAVRDWIARRAVAVRVDGEREAALAQRFRVTSYPTIVFLRADGSELDRLAGATDARAFLDTARSVAAGRTPIQVAQARADASPGDIDARLQLARRLAAKRRDAEALEQWLRCFDEIPERAPDWRPVRLTSLLREIQELGSRYPAALDALRTRAATARRRLEGRGSADRDAALDFAALAKTTGDAGAVVDVLDALAGRADRVEARRELAESTLDDLVARKRYADAADAIPDFRGRAMREVLAAADALQGVEAIEREVPGARRILEISYRKQLGRSFEVLLGAGRNADAADVAARILERMPGAATLAELAVHARGTGRPASDLRAAAAALPGDDRDRVARLLDALEPER